MNNAQTATAPQGNIEDQRRKLLSIAADQESPNSITVRLTPIAHAVRILFDMMARADEVKREDVWRQELAQASLQTQHPCA
jgi:hypothetical protein